MQAHQTFPTLLGAAVWTLLLLMGVGLPIPVLLAEGSAGGEIPASTVQLFFLAASSWLGAWLAVFGDSFVSRYRWEGSRLSWLGTAQALFPFLAPFLVVYALASGS